MMDIGAQDVKEAELHVCPLIEEDTHHQKFTTVTHSDYMVELLEERKSDLIDVTEEEEEAQDEIPIIDLALPGDAAAGPAAPEPCTIAEDADKKRKQHDLSRKIIDLQSMRRKGRKTSQRSNG